eukprot:g3986.t1
MIRSVSQTIGERPPIRSSVKVEEYVDMFSSGIIDAAKVTKTALVDATSVASLLTTSEVIITDLPEKAADGRAGMGDMGGGMGGMGGGMGEQEGGAGASIVAD